MASLCESKAQMAGEPPSLQKTLASPPPEAMPAPADAPRVPQQAPQKPHRPQRTNGSAAAAPIRAAAAAAAALLLLCGPSAHAAAPNDLTNFQGLHGCDSSVLMGRPQARTFFL